MLVKHKEARLIGINTPEYDQALGSEATRSLEELLKGKRVLVQYGREKKDRYGRALLHLQTSKGINPASEQLKRGYAFHILVPPNEFNAECYGAAEEEARQQNKNIWQHPDYQPQQASKHYSISGFQRIAGQVEDVRMKKSGIELRVKDSPLTLFISNANLASFGDYQTIKKWIGQNFIARGWISRWTYKGRDYVSLRLSHPSMVECVEKTIGCSRTRIKVFSE